MNFSRSLCITQGPRAGLPRASTDAVMDDLTLVKRVAALLKRNGLIVRRSEIDSGIQPVIQVEASRITDRMIYENQAAYYYWAKGMRHGQFVVDGCAWYGSRPILMRRGEATDETHQAIY